MDSFLWISIIVLAYIIVSNIIWLLLGSKAVQYLPGISINGGTIRISIMIMLSIVGVLFWIIKYILSLIFVIKIKPILSRDISMMIQKGYKTVNKLRLGKNIKV